MRVKDARMLASLAKVQKRNKAGLITSITIPGSNAKSYDEIIRRRNGTLTVQCLLNTSGGHLACKGNSVSLCYHAIGGAIAMIENSGYKVVAIADQRANAIRRKRIGGKMVEVRSYQSGKPLWMLYEKNGRGK